MYTLIQHNQSDCILILSYYLRWDL
jgi:hypothetical protein